MKSQWRKLVLPLCTVICRTRFTKLFTHRIKWCIDIYLERLSKYWMIFEILFLDKWWICVRKFLTSTTEGLLTKLMCQYFKKLQFCLVSKIIFSTALHIFFWFIQAYCKIKLSLPYFLFLIILQITQENKWPEKMQETKKLLNWTRNYKKMPLDFNGAP